MNVVSPSIVDRGAVTKFDTVLRVVIKLCNLAVVGDGVLVNISIASSSSNVELDRSDDNLTLRFVLSMEHGPPDTEDN